MADFTSTQTQLASARAAQDAAQLAQLQATARAVKAQSALDLATRQSSAGGNNAQNLATLKAAAEQAAAAEAAARGALKAARATVNQAASTFGGFSDPRQSVGLLSNAAPFLLLPVRIETRFRTAATATKPGALADGGARTPAAGAHLSRRLLDRHLRAADISIGTHQRQELLDEHVARRRRPER